LNELYPLSAEILDGRREGRIYVPGPGLRSRRGPFVTDGFAYHGRIAALNGKFIFGDIF